MTTKMRETVGLDGVGYKLVELVSRKDADRRNIDCGGYTPTKDAPFCILAKTRFMGGAIKWSIMRQFSGAENIDYHWNMITNTFADER